VKFLENLILIQKTLVTSSYNIQNYLITLLPYLNDHIKRQVLPMNTSNFWFIIRIHWKNKVNKVSWVGLITWLL